MAVFDPVVYDGLVFDAGAVAATTGRDPRRVGYARPYGGHYEEPERPRYPEIERLYDALIQAETAAEAPKPAKKAAKAAAKAVSQAVGKLALFDDDLVADLQAKSNDLERHLLAMRRQAVLDQAAAEQAAALARDMLEQLERHALEMDDQDAMDAISALMMAA
jgi:hypothetical protein